MRRAMVCALLAALALPAFGDEAADRRTCANRRQDQEKRIAACTRLIDNDALPPEDRAWALVERGHTLRWQDKDDEAFADYARAVELDPTNPEGFKARGRIHYGESRYADAAADFTHAIELDPRNGWTWVARGDTYRAMGKYDEALPDYAKAIRVNPRNVDAYVGRAHLYRVQEKYEQALEDANGVLALSQYNAFGYSVRGRTHEDLGHKTEAVHDFRVALLLNPNLDPAESGLERLVGELAPSGSEPVPYAEPKAGLRVTYLQVVTPPKGRADDMEEAIFALADWFRRRKLPLPIRKNFIRREVLASDGGQVEARSTKNPDAEVERDRESEDIGYYRSLWATSLVGPQKQRLDIVLDKPAIDALWPLTPGATGEGTGKLEWLCPDPPDEFAKFLGCNEAGKRLPMGSVEWKAEVVARERIVVGAGVFDTVKVRYDEVMTLTMLGRSVTRPSVVTIWYAPKIGWWVKRTREFDQDGPKIAIDEAVRIE